MGPWMWWYLVSSKLLREEVLSAEKIESVVLLFDVGINNASDRTNQCTTSTYRTDNASLGYKSQ
jgi:hypothetical protein